MVDLRVKRRPAYVHSPSTIRELVCPLLVYNTKQRETLCLNVQSLVANNPEARLRKCFQYARDSEKTWLIYQVVIIELLESINLDTMHFNDIERTIELFLILRYYTFEVPIDKLRQALSVDVFEGMGINKSTRTTILGIATKVAKGITPRILSKDDYWDDDIIDDWLSKVK